MASSDEKWPKVCPAIIEIDTVVLAFCAKKSSHSMTISANYQKVSRDFWRCRDVASGIDKHPDRTEIISDCRYRVIESSSLVPVIFREVFSHPYISLFHLLVNVFSVIREYDSTLYVGLARAVSPTNTNFRLTFLLTRLQEALYEDLAV